MSSSPHHRVPATLPTGFTLPTLGRRELVGGVTLGGLMLASGLSCAGGAQRGAGPEHQRSARTTTGRPLGIALLGLGDYAKSQLAPALAKTQHCKLRGIVTGSPQKVAQWQSDYDIPDKNVYDYTSLPQIKDNPDIDIVYVVTPTALHAKYAIMAAEAGKHVFCEKPMAMNPAECQAIIDACKKHGRQLAIGYRLHHEPNTQTVMQLAKQAPYGKIQEIRAVAGDKDNGDFSWRMQRSMGGGALYDMGVYSINAIRYASGEEPVRVRRARQWSERPEFSDVDEITEFELELPSGAVGFGRASRHDSGNKLRVTAERGWYELEPMQAYTGVSGKTSDGRELDREIDNQQAQQMDDEALAILEKRPPVVPGEEGLRDVRIVVAIIDSAKRGAPVTL
ncbi:MAG: Gfo/Idh/MocA family oxidoreductase [Polyangiales bacterium]